MRLKALLAGLVLVSPLAGQSPGIVEADSLTIVVLRDLLAAATSWKGDGGRLCVDPWVARYAQTSIQRWSPASLRELLRDQFVAIDSSAGAVPPGSRTCARSRGTARLAFGVPRVTRDSGAVVFVASRLDTRAQADSFLFDFRLERADQQWRVAGWLADSQTAHTYIRGEGCYRFSHPLFADHALRRIRINAGIVRAEDAVVGPSWNGFPARRLVPGAAQVGVDVFDRNGYAHWWATHDTLHLYWAAINSFLSVDLLVMGDSLRGSMRFETDAIVPNPPRVDVRGRRVRCA